MSLDAKRWWERAHDLKFHQLEAARRQAESWRTGLAGSTALLGAALVIKGPDNVSRLTPGFRWLVVVLVGLALASLLTATLLAVGASAGTPGRRIVLTGEDLRAWSEQEVRSIGRALRWAARLTVLGVVAVGVAVACTWLGPGRATAGLVVVESSTERSCGTLLGSDGGRLAIQTSSGTVRLVAFANVRSVSPTRAC
ncbi:hypothetical protein [Cryptosporangium sp. NPDC048952]|uniref:hypothetical protein n=1 Tax=Cryptosporangium sp. NPDC048952 TaxID=3363961 RepID=UPI00370F98FF